MDTEVKAHQHLDPYSTKSQASVHFFCQVFNPALNLINLFTFQSCHNPSSFARVTKTIHRLRLVFWDLENAKYSEQAHIIKMCLIVLYKYGLVPHNVLDDGTCMLRALLHSCGLNQKHHLTLRKLMAYGVYRNWIEVAPTASNASHPQYVYPHEHPVPAFMMDPRDHLNNADRYYEHAILPGTWFAGLELGSFTSAFKTSLMVHKVEINDDGIPTFTHLRFDYERTVEEIGQDYTPPLIHILEVRVGGRSARADHASADTT